MKKVLSWQLNQVLGLETSVILDIRWIVFCTHPPAFIFAVQSMKVCFQGWEFIKITCVIIVKLPCMFIWTGPCGVKTVMTNILWCHCLDSCLLISQQFYPPLLLHHCCKRQHRKKHYYHDKKPFWLFRPHGRVLGTPRSPPRTTVWQLLPEENHY